MILNKIAYWILSAIAGYVWYQSDPEFRKRIDADVAALEVGSRG